MRAQPRRSVQALRLGCARMARRDKAQERAIARERVARLVELAEAALRAGRADRADRYADLAWRVKTTYQLRGTPLDGRVCRKCRAFLVPGRSSRVRLTGGRRSVTCLRCGTVRRKVLAAPTAAAPPREDEA